MRDHHESARERRIALYKSDHESAPERRIALYKSNHHESAWEWRIALYKSDHHDSAWEQRIALYKSYHDHCHHYHQTRSTLPSPSKFPVYYAAHSFTHFENTNTIVIDHCTSFQYRTPFSVFRTETTHSSVYFMLVPYRVNNNVNFSCAHQCPERSHDTY